MIYAKACRGQITPSFLLFLEGSNCPRWFCSPSRLSHALYAVGKLIMYRAELKPRRYSPRIFFYFTLTIEATLELHLKAQTGIAQRLPINMTLTKNTAAHLPWFSLSRIDAREADPYTVFFYLLESYKLCGLFYGSTLSSVVSLY